MERFVVYYDELAAFAEQASSGRFRLLCAHGCGEQGD
jgi:hypothetical protein